jgi:cell division protein FtsN
LRTLVLITDYAVRPVGEAQGSPEPTKTPARAEREADRKSSPPRFGKDSNQGGPAHGGGPSRKESPPPPAEREAKKSGPATHYLHVGSYRERQNAEKHAQELVRHGHKAFFVEEGGADGKWFRVYVGEFQSEREARRVGTEMKEKRLITYFKPISFPGGVPSGQRVQGQNRRILNQK